MSVAFLVVLLIKILILAGMLALLTRWAWNIHKNGFITVSDEYEADANAFYPSMEELPIDEDSKSDQDQ